MPKISINGSTFDFQYHPKDDMIRMRKLVTGDDGNLLVDEYEGTPNLQTFNSGTKSITYRYYALTHKPSSIEIVNYAQWKTRRAALASLIILFFRIDGTSKKPESVNSSGILPLLPE